MRRQALDTSGARRDGGFTLVEVLVSVALLAFVALGVMALLTSVVRQNKLAKERSTATALASERINELTSQPFQAAADYLRYRRSEETAAAGPPRTLTADYGQIPGYPEYRRVVTLTYDTPVTGMLTVRTEVFWSNRAQGAKSHAMVTYLHPGLEEGQ
jgi:prepilin-type N-terminal cleavage/methylation domain-containing protein